MNNILNKHQDILKHIEEDSLKIMEEKLDDFFIENSIIYSFSLLNHIEFYNKGCLGMFIISSKQIENLIKSIIFEINHTQKVYILDSRYNIFNDVELDAIIIALIKEYNYSLNLTFQCENIINKTVLKSLKLVFSNKIFLNIKKETNLGAFMISKNNYVTMQYKYRKEIYNQIQGILLNSKYEIKNQLTNYIIKNLRINELENNKKLMITA